MNKFVLSILISFFVMLSALALADELVEYYEKGYVALKQHDYDTAIASFEKVLKLLNIDPIEAGKEYKKRMADIKKNPKTKDGRDRAIVFNKLWLDTYYYLGLVYAHKGDKANALKQVINLRHIGRDDYADSLEGEINYIINKPEPTPEQKELATVVGIVLEGMTKEGVLKTLGSPKKEGKCISTDQEVWYYKYPEEQIIYFSGDVVDKVYYLPEKKKIEIKDVEWL